MLVAFGMQKPELDESGSKKASLTAAAYLYVEWENACANSASLPAGRDRRGARAQSGATSKSEPRGVQDSALCVFLNHIKRL